MLLPGESSWVQVEELAREGNANLSDGNNEPHENEHCVLVETLEDVPLVVDLSRADHVPDLHEHEEVEYPSHVARRVAGLFEDRRIERIVVPVVGSSWEDAAGAFEWWVLVLSLGLWYEVFTSEDGGEEHEAHIQCHDVDVFHHLPRDNVVVSVLRRPFEKFWLGHFSGQSESSKGVHDQVDPEELDSVKWSLSSRQGCDENSQQGVDVDSELELEEALDIVENIPSPGAGLHD